MERSKEEIIKFLEETSKKLAPNASEERAKEFVESMLKRISFGGTKL